jgi:ATP-dependent Clp protease, protease subunit
VTIPTTGSFPPPRPGQPGWPGHPLRPGRPGQPGRPPEPPAPSAPNPALAPTRIWVDQGEWPGKLYDRLLSQRIVIASGWLDGDLATRLSAQLLTLDAEGDGPVRLEIQGLDADLAAALSVMGVLDVLRAPVSAYVGGRVAGPALGVIASARCRYAYPNAMLVLSEPRMSFDGKVTAVRAREEQVRSMAGDLFARLAEVTGRDVDSVRADAAAEKLLTVPDAIDYGLIDGPAEPRRPAPSRGGLPR